MCISNPFNASCDITSSIWYSCWCSSYLKDELGEFQLEQVKHDLKFIENEAG